MKTEGIGGDLAAWLIVMTDNRWVVVGVCCGGGSDVPGLPHRSPYSTPQHCPAQHPSPTAESAWGHVGAGGGLRRGLGLVQA